MNAPNPRALHWRLSAFYFVYYAAVGAFIPYWPLYLQALGYGPAQIGAAYAVVGAVRIAFPVLWGWLMDRSGRRGALIAVGMSLACLSFSLIPFSTSFATMLLLHFIYAAFWNAGLPAFDVVTLNHVARSGGDYSRIRLWGSVGFVLSVALLGPLFDVTGVAPLPWIVAAAMLAMASIAWTVPDSSDSRSESAAPLRLAEVLQRPAVLALLAVAFLSQFSFAPFYGFFSIYLQGHGYGRTTIGALWALGVLAEVGIFIYAGRLIGRFGAAVMLRLALASTALRWAMLAVVVDSLPLLALSQLLHLSSFGLYHAVTVHYVHRCFPGRLQGRGQALLAAVSFGLGGAIGSLLSGYGWEHYSGPAVYLGATLAAGAGFLVAWRRVRD